MKFIPEMCRMYYILSEIDFLFFNSKNAEWSVVSSVVETRNFSETKPGGTVRTYSVIDFTMTIKRNPSHYISATILPVLATSVLSILVFILPVESGEKVGYTLTVLLAEAVLLTLVQDSMPSSSQHTSYLCMYLRSSFSYQGNRRSNRYIYIFILCSVHHVNIENNQNYSLQ